MNGLIKLIEEEFKKNDINFDNSLNANYIDDSFGAVMICIENVVKNLHIPDVVGMLPKCEHRNIDRQDGCDECLDCGVRNY